MKNIIKLSLIICCVGITQLCRCQEINLGGEVSVFPGVYLGNSAVNMNILYEYRPKGAFFSINTNPGIIISDNKIIGSFPIFLNFVTGNKYSLCPNIGVFYWTSRTRGWSAGLNFEVKVKDKFTSFIGANYILAYYEEFHPSHFGSGAYHTTSSPAVKLSIGFKYRINKPVPNKT